MIQISMTEFVDFVTKPGPPRLTVVKQAKKRHEDGYDPKTDFYKKLRDGIVQHHQAGQPKSALDALAQGVTDKNKIKAYPLIIQGYKKFLGNKKVKWSNPTKAAWVHGDLGVNVNPEIGLEINGKPHLIKLYFKADKLSKIQLQAILHLMQLKLGKTKKPVTLGVLEVRRGKLHIAGPLDPSLTALVEGEAQAFASMYKAV